MHNFKVLLITNEARCCDRSEGRDLGTTVSHRSILTGVLNFTSISSCDSGAIGYVSVIFARVPVSNTTTRKTCTLPTYASLPWRSRTENSFCARQVF